MLSLSRPSPRLLYIYYKGVRPHNSHTTLLRASGFATTYRGRAASESPDFRETPLFRQLAANPDALTALKQFQQLMKEQGIELSASNPPSGIQLFRLLGNARFREGLQQLKSDLEKAGVNADPENAMAMLEAFRSQEPKK
ncbi:hypothetical protein BU17DRAFT_80131 [Hysterangium stoloniferum]|nr:hypothetical protein BU17DRAFT_80131 [Hysterangium stoloniferum]